MARIHKNDGIYASRDGFKQVTVAMS